MGIVQVKYMEKEDLGLKYGPKSIKYKRICVKVYMTVDEFKAVFHSAQQHGYIHGGTKPFRIYSTGWQETRVANTKNIAKYIKDLFKFEKEEYSDYIRLKRKEELEQKLKELE